MPTDTKLISLEDATKIAIQTIIAIYKDKQIHNLLLEEAELTEDEKNWLITIGFDVVNDLDSGSRASLAILARENFERKYKVAKIDSKNGKFKGFKIREL